MTPAVDNLNIRHLLAANYIYQSKSVTEAAASLFLSQSAVSQGLTKLEHQLGCKLLSRSNAGATPTEIGEVFLYRANRAINYLDRAGVILGQDATANFSRTLTASMLKAFAQTVRTESLSLAAAQLGITQPSVHRSIEGFERVCRTQLFYRSAFGVQPTHQARQIAQCVELYFSELQQSLDTLEQARGGTNGRLNVGSLPLARSQWVPAAITALLAQYPAANISIFDGPYETQINDLVHGRIDLLVGALRDATKSLPIVEVPIFEDELSIVVRKGHPLETARQIDPVTLSNFDWITPRRETPGRKAFEQLFNSAGLQAPSQVIECGSLVAVRKLLLMSDRVTLLSSKQVADDVDAEILSVLPKRLPETSRTIGLCYRKDWEPTPLQERFIAELTLCLA